MESTATEKEYAFKELSHVSKLDVGVTKSLHVWSLSKRCSHFHFQIFVGRIPVDSEIRKQLRSHPSPALPSRQELALLSGKVNKAPIRRDLLTFLTSTEHC